MMLPFLKTGTILDKQGMTQDIIIPEGEIIIKFKKDKGLITFKMKAENINLRINHVMLNQVDTITGSIKSRKEIPRMKTIELTANVPGDIEPSMKRSKKRK